MSRAEEHCPALETHVAPLPDALVPATVTAETVEEIGLEMAPRYYDLTALLSEKTVVFPGDPSYNAQPVCCLESGSAFNLCLLQLGNHTGTHIDYPAHVLKQGKTSSDYAVDHLIGPGIIIKVPNTETSITKSFVSQQAILFNDIVFFKTANSNISKQMDFTEQYVYIELEAAEELLSKRVKIVGIDYLSVDRYDASELPVHVALLSRDVLVVEGLELRHAPEGRATFCILPLNIPLMDGLPARVVCRMG